VKTPIAITILTAAVSQFPFAAIRAVKMVMAMGVFTNDRAMFERALHYYVNGAAPISGLPGTCPAPGDCPRHRHDGHAHQVISPRGPFRPVFEQIYNHYVNRQGIPAPYTQRVAGKVRPEGAAQGADHPGFGTLLYSRPRATMKQRAERRRACVRPFT